MNDKKIFKAIEKIKDVVDVKHRYEIDEFKKLKKIGIVSNDYSLYIQAKTEFSKNILYYFINKQDQIYNEFEYPKNETINTTGFDCKLLDYTINLIKISSNKIDERIELSFSKNYPLLIENENFRIILCPLREKSG